MGNPYTHVESDLAEFVVETREEAIQNYAEWLVEQDELMEDLYELDVKILGCHCVPNICHGTILAEFVDRLDESFKYDIYKLKSRNGKDMLQEIYNYIFDLWEHIEIEGTDRFISTTKDVVNHFNKGREKDNNIESKK